VKLRGLDPTAAYRFTELDEQGTHPARTLAGREAMNAGVELTSTESPSAVNLIYEKISAAR